MRAESKGCERTRLGRAKAGMGAAWRGSTSDLIGSSRRQSGALPFCVAVLLVLWAGAPGAGAFKFVYIPCEQDQPMEEWCLTPRGQDDEIGCLTQRLQEWYGKRGLTEEQRAHFKEQVRFHMQQKNPEQKTAELLEPKDPTIADVSDRILSHESVEIVTVLPPMSRFGYVSVSLYVDDKGVARGLPLNHRATSLLETVSTRKGPILGDAFVARTYDNEADEVSGFIRLDLGVADISSSAGWVKVCQEQKLLSIQNEDKVQEAMHDIKNARNIQLTSKDKQKHALQEMERSDEAEAAKDELNPLLRDGYAVFPATQGPAATSARECLAAAVELRERGNEFYNAKNLAVAARKYAKARRYLMHAYFVSPAAEDSIDEAEHRALLTKTELNLALAAFHMARAAQCETTCKLVLHREPSNIKALYRLGCCQRDYGDPEAARATFSKGCDVAPEDACMRRALKSIDVKIRRDQRASDGLASSMFKRGMGCLYTQEDAPQDLSGQVQGGGAMQTERDGADAGVQGDEGGVDGVGAEAADENEYGQNRPWRGQEGDGEEERHFQTDDMDLAAAELERLRHQEEQRVGADGRCGNDVGFAAAASDMRRRLRASAHVDDDPMLRGSTRWRRLLRR